MDINFIFLDAKVQRIFDMTKLFGKKLQILLIF